MVSKEVILEKMKDLGLRHGEKAGVLIASMIFFVCVGMAAVMPTISTTPEKVKQVTQQSESNLTRREDRDTIVKNLEEKGIKDNNFTKLVDDQVKTALVSDEYKPAREWVSTEPGAGLIRDTPVLIAPTELYAYPGRGGLLVYELDEKTGERIADTGTDRSKDQPARRRRRRRNPAMGGGGMAGGLGQRKKKATKSRADLEREAREETERLRKQLAGKLVGADQADEAQANADAVDTEPPSKEITKGYRWVALTGVLDHAKMLANYRQALKNPAVAHPNYKRLDVQRKTLQSDDTWSKWESVSSDENLKVLDNLPEVDEELAPVSVLPDALVDPLPFLKAGLWEKVHIASLVPREKKTIADQNIPAGGMMGGGMMGRGMGGAMMARMMGQRMNTGGGAPGAGMMGGGMGGGMMGRAMMGMGGGMMGRGMMGGGMMGGGMMGGGMMGRGTEAVMDYWKSEENKVMIRGFDFTVEPDTTYRYRVRIVVFNPNRNRDDVEPGVDTKVEELKGPWSDPSDDVHMPSDVMPYLTGILPASPSSDVKARFQVIRFHPANGVTVPHSFEASAGEIIGEPRTAEVPVSDGSGKQSRTIDFNSHQIVLDVYVSKSAWGTQPLPPGFIGAPIDRPALALLLRPDDGSVVAHSESDDIANDVRRDIYNNYRHEISQSSKKRTSSMGLGMMGGMRARMMGGRR